jgi:hypothetical protein
MNTTAIIAVLAALLPGMMACALIYLGLRTKPRSPAILIWAVLLLGAAFGMLEWAFWLSGINIFITFIFPLLAYFAIWFGFIIWIFECRHERRIWLAFLIALAILVLIALSCMNCLAI